MPAYRIKVFIAAVMFLGTSGCASNPPWYADGANDIPPCSTYRLKLGVCAMGYNDQRPDFWAAKMRRM